MVSNNDVYVTQEEIIKLEQDLIKMEHALYDKYCDVGKSILEKVEQESKQINSMVDQIIETRQILAGAKQEKCCPKCALFNDNNSLYCKHCGAGLIDTEDTKEDNNGTK